MYLSAIQEHVKQPIFDILSDNVLETAGPSTELLPDAIRQSPLSAKPLCLDEVRSSDAFWQRGLNDWLVPAR
jgi:hypothetical protein